VESLAVRLRGRRSWLYRDRYSPGELHAACAVSHPKPRRQCPAGDLSHNVASGGEHWNFLAFSAFRCGANSTRPIGEGRETIRTVFRTPDGGWRYRLLVERDSSHHMDLPASFRAGSGAGVSRVLFKSSVNTSRGSGDEDRKPGSRPGLELPAVKARSSEGWRIRKAALAGLRRHRSMADRRICQITRDLTERESRADAQQAKNSSGCSCGRHRLRHLLDAKAGPTGISVRKDQRLPAAQYRPPLSIYG
jgi:hypothetical protein